MKKYFMPLFTIMLLMVNTVGVFAEELSVLTNEGQAGTTLTAEVTASAWWKRTFSWNIDKSVTPATWAMFKGDQGTSEYTVAVTKGGAVDTSGVSGQVCVTNGGAVTTEDLTIDVKLLSKTGGGAFTYTGIHTVLNPPELSPGQSACFPYEILFTPTPGTDYKISADVTITNHSGSLGIPKGPSPDASFSLPASPIPINDGINVTDTNGGSWSTTSSTSWKYTRTFTCNSDSGTHGNTATIVQTKQSDDAAVTINCYGLAVTKNAATSLTRTYNWTIDKSADQNLLTLAKGQTFTVNYTITPGVSHIDSNWAVAGSIYVNNPAPINAKINSLSDVITTALGANVSCPVSFPYTLAAGGTLTCTYSRSLPDAATRTNTATAVLQNFSYDKTGAPTAAGTTEFSGSAAVNFASAVINKIDECVSINDSQKGIIYNTLCENELPKPYSYTMNIGPYEACGTFYVPNIVTLETKDTHTTRTDNWTITVNVPCPTGCTLTIGYWKNHAGFGPQDDMVSEHLPIWLGTAGGTNSKLVSTAKEAVEFLSMNVYGTPSNGITKLYAQLLAAKLNIASGANGSSIQGTLTAVDGFLSSKDYTGYSKLNKLSKMWISNWLTTLDNFNNGYLGVPHCSM